MRRVGMRSTRPGDNHRPSAPPVCTGLRFARRILVSASCAALGAEVYQNAPSAPTKNFAIGSIGGTRLELQSTLRMDRAERLRQLVGIVGLEFFGSLQQRVPRLGIEAHHGAVAGDDRRHSARAVIVSIARSAVKFVETSNSMKSTPSEQDTPGGATVRARRDRVELVPHRHLVDVAVSTQCREVDGKCQLRTRWHDVDPKIGTGNPILQTEGVRLARIVQEFPEKLHSTGRTRRRRCKYQ